MVGMLKSQEWFSDHPYDTLYHLVFCKAPHRVSAAGQCSWRHPYIVVRNTGWVCLAPILLSPVWPIHHWIIMDGTEHIYTHPFLSLNFISNSPSERQAICSSLLNYALFTCSGNPFLLLRIVPQAKALWWCRYLYSGRLLYQCTNDTLAAAMVAWG